MLNKEQKRIIFLSSIGGMLEFYDFTIYGFFAAYFAAQFFPSHSSFSTIMATYSVFLIGYVVRPIGGIIFSHIGDEIGRKTALIITMVLMGVASLGMGLLPTYAQIGIWAPILMVTLRLLQGLAIGGELPSTIVYAAESIPNQRAVALGTIFSIVIAGLIPGMLINVFLTHYLSVEELNHFGWRIPFIIGGLLCIVAYQVRRKLHETKAFSHLKQHDKFPLATLIENNFSKLMIGVGLVSIMATPIILAIIFMPTYLTRILKYNSGQVSSTIIFTTVLSVLCVYMMGVLASRFSPYKLMRNCTVGLVLASAICYFMLFKGYNLMLALSIFTIFQGLLVTMPPIMLSYLFPVKIRLTGVALSYNLAFVIFGGLTPVVVTTIAQHTQRVYMAPFICILITALVALFALKKCPRIQLVSATH